MKKVLAFCLCLVTLAFAAGKPVVKIGVVVPTSGNMSWLGENAREAIKLKLSELPTNRRFDYQLVYEDDGFVFSQTAAAIQKLKNIDKVDAIIDLWGYSSDIAVPILKDSKILHLSADRWSEPPAYAYDFSAGCPVDDYVTPTVEALKKLGVKKVGIFSYAEHGIQECTTKLKKQLKAASIGVGEEIVVSQQRDFRTWLLKLRESKPDMLVCIGTMPAQEIVLRQMKVMGYRLPFCAVGAALWDINPVYSEGAFFVDPAPANDAFAKAFKAQAGRDYRYPATQFYDALTALIGAYESTQFLAVAAGSKPPPDGVVFAFKNLPDTPGATGTIQFCPPNRLKTPLSYYLIQAKQPRKAALDEVVSSLKR